MAGGFFICFFGDYEMKFLLDHGLLKIYHTEGVLAAEKVDFV